MLSAAGQFAAGGGRFHKLLENRNVRALSRFRLTGILSIQLIPRPRGLLTQPSKGQLSSASLLPGAFDSHHSHAGLPLAIIYSRTVDKLLSSEVVPPQKSREGWALLCFSPSLTSPAKSKEIMDGGLWMVRIEIVKCGADTHTHTHTHKRSLEWQAGDKENAAGEDITAADLITQTCTRSSLLAFDFVSYCRSLHLWNASFSSLSFSGWAGSPPPPAVVYLSGNSGAAAGTKWLPDACCWHRWELATEKPLAGNAFSQTI